MKGVWWAAKSVQEHRLAGTKPRKRANSKEGSQQVATFASAACVDSACEAGIDRR